MGSVLGLVALLLAADDWERRWTASATASAAVFRDELALTGSFEAAFEPLPFLRVFNFGAEAKTPRGAAWRAASPRLLLGVEGIASPLFPLELSAGGALGFADGYVCGGRECLGTLVWAAQLRAFAGFRVRAWLTVGLLASWNAYVVTFPQQSWVEAGPRVSVRW